MEIEKGNWGYCKVRDVIEGIQCWNQGAEGVK
jgi:hypothetical protein